MTSDLLDVEAGFDAWARHEGERIRARVSSLTPEQWERFWQLNPRLRPPGGPRDRVAAELWDVRWEGYGFGKHGNGPFLTKGQATRCLNAIGFRGTVEQLLVTMDRAQLDVVIRRGKA